MNKFFTLLSKEVRELITPIVLVPLVITVALFVGLGNILSKENDRAKQPQPIAILDLDKTATSTEIVDALGKANFKVSASPVTTEQGAVEAFRSSSDSILVVIHKGFENGLMNSQQVQSVAEYSNVRGFSQSSSQQAVSLSTINQLMNQVASDRLLAATAPTSDPARLKAPVMPIEHVLVGKNEAQVSLGEIFGFISSQIYFIPIILFVVIMFAAQMIATSIATEKENKTLETLLSTPVSRKQLVAAKLVAAGLVALLYAAAYMVAFRYYMNGITGGAGSLSSSAIAAAHQLGLTFAAKDYLLLGLSLFFGILCALSIAMILGTFAEDVKSAQGVIAPFSFVIAIPYLLVMFLDLNHLSPLGRTLLYAIPFSHPFLAPQFIWTHNYSPVLYGILYQLVVFLIFVYIASWIFSTDRIVTIKLNFKKRRL